MDFNLEKLYEKLKHHNPQLFIKDRRLSNITLASLLAENTEKFKSDCVYVGLSSQLIKKNLNGCVFNIICIIDKPISESLIDNLNVNLILLNTKIDLYVLLNEVQQFLLEYEIYSTCLAKFMEGLIQGRGLQNLLDIGYRFLENPILLHDLGFKLLGHIKGIDAKIDDPFWSDIVSNGYSSAEIVTHFKNQKYYEQVYKSKLPIYGMWQEPKNNRIISHVYIDNRIVGTLYILEYERHFKQIDNEIITLLCDAISIEFQKSKNYHNTKQVMYENFIIELLDEKLTKIEVIREREKYLGLQLKENLYVISINYSQLDSISTISNISQLLEDMLFGSTTILYKNLIIILISRSKDKPLLQKELHELETFLKRNNLYGGCSRSFSSIVELLEYFKQSVNSLELGNYMNKKKNLFFYDDIVFYHILSIYSKDELKNFCHPAILALMKLDKKNDSSYIQTIYSYILNSKEKSATADMLHIHRNTLNYRISKIEDYVSLDLNDPNLLFHLCLSCKVLEFIEGTKLI